MPLKPHASNPQSGFTAVVVAALFIAFAVIAAAAVERNTTLQQFTRRDKTAEQLTRLSNAIIEYSVFNKNGSINLYPCPARADVATSSATFGDAATSCWTTTPTSVELLGGTVLRGMVPVLALSSYGITLEDAFDAWNNRIMYIVNRDLTINSTNYSGAQARNPTVTDARTGLTITAPDFILVSYGKDGRGATKRSSTSVGVACPSSSTVLREENCDVDTVFTVAPLNTSNNATAATYFDDTLTWYASGGGTAAGAVATPSSYTLYCWGSNSNGKLGDSTTTDRYVATAVTPPSGITKFQAVSVGAYSACAIGSDGKGYCWGYNTYGQLGHGSADAGTSTATLVTMPAGASSFSSISSGSNFSCAIGSDNLAYCWGHNGWAQLGHGSGAHTYVPTAVTLPSGVTSFTAVSAGANHACGIGNNGRAYCWGAGGSGQIGNNDTSSQTVPTAVNLPSGVTSFTSIKAGSNATCAIGNNNRAYCWGMALYYQLGNGGGADSPIPVPVDLGATATSYSAVSIGSGGMHACAIGNDGKAYCWGHNDSGQTGRGNTSDPQNSVLSVVFPSGVTSFTSVSAGDVHTCGIGNNSRAYCWGENSAGPIGINVNGGTYTNAQAVNLPSGITSFVSVTAGSYESCGLAQ